MSDKTTNLPQNDKPGFALEEIGGDHFADITQAQQAALSQLAADMANTLRALIASGALAVQGGRVIVTEVKTR